jgi:hypothetical protein
LRRSTSPRSCATPIPVKPAIESAV